MNKRALVVEDDVNIAELLRLYLGKDGFEVMIAPDGGKAKSAFDLFQPDVVLLDIMLPVKDGWQVCREIREKSSTPIIMITAKGETADKVNGLEMGADDYITKPFDTEELLARTALRIKEHSALPCCDFCTYKDLMLDYTTHTARVADRSAALTRTEFAILKLLMQNPNAVIAKSVLLDHISADTPDCTESSLKTHISHLRAKLRGISEKEYVESVWGIGFKLR